jgi:hypothetical protein
MRPFFVLLLLAAAAARGDEVADRLAIETAVAALNNVATVEGMSAQFTSDAVHAEVRRLFETHRSMTEAARQPMSELSLPHISSQSVRFITPDVALVDGMDNQIGSLGPKRVRLLLLMRREGAGWKIAMARIW